MRFWRIEAFDDAGYLITEEPIIRRTEEGATKVYYRLLAQGACDASMSAYDGCADCGVAGERTGHQDCQYPQDH